MKSNHPGAGAGQPRRFLVPIILGIGAMAVVGLLMLRQRVPKPVEIAQTPVVPAEATVPAPLEAELPPPSVEPANHPVKEATTPQRPAPTETAPAQPERPVASAETRQMVEALTKLNTGGVPLTQEQVTAWRQNLQSLIQQGAAGIPAIRDYLALNKDLMFGSADARMLGYDSVRNAMFDALRQIGGAEGTQGLIDALHGTGDPREVLTIARNLDSMAPGQHQGELLEAARQVLGMASRGELKDYDVGPLFEVFQKYGGADAMGDLMQAGGQWKYYSAIGLANLPDGAGIPSLIQMATGTGGNRQLATEMLAQVALQSPEAKAVLLNQVRSGMISPNHWPYMASVLGGDYYQLPDALWYAAQNGAPIDRQKTAHIGYGNQNFYQGPLPGGGTAEFLSQQIALVDEIAAMTSDPAAAQALQNAKTTLNRRLSRFTATPAPPAQ